MILLIRKNSLLDQIILRFVPRSIGRYYAVRVGHDYGTWRRFMLRR